MQKHNLPLLSLNRENYEVPKGEEHLVHYKAERVLFSSNGLTRVSHPDLIKTSTKMFDEVKRNLELQGYTIEILFHPEGKYTNVTLPKDTGEELREKDEEIARLKAELAKEKSKAKVEDAPSKEEAKEEKEGEDAPTPKRGRPSKSNE